MTRLVVDPPDLDLWPTVRRLYPVWRTQWRLVLIGVACAIVLTGLSLSIPILIQHAIDDAILKHDQGKLLLFLGAIVVIASVRFAVNFTRRYATARVGIRVEALMREYLYSAYLRYPRAFYDRHATGEVVSRATNDLYPIRYFIGWGLIQGTQSLLMIVGASAVLLTVNAKLMLLAAIAMPFVGLLAWFFAHKVFPISRRVQEKKAVVTEAADEAVVGIEMVQAFGREDDVRDRFAGRAEVLRDETMNQAGVEARYIPGLFFVPSLGIAAVVYFGGKDVIAGTLTLGQFTLFMQLLLMLVWPLEALGWIINLGQRALASASRAFAWLDGIEPLPEPRSPRALPRVRDLVAHEEGDRGNRGGSPDGAADALHRRLSDEFAPLPVELEGVRFSYATGAEVLRGVDLEVPPGQIVAVCGPTASGKTSLLNLLPRFYDPTEGYVRVGGVDVRDVALADLRSAVGVVTQKPVLFSVPLRDNLTAARPDAPWHEVLAACEAAGVAAFVDDLPDGYDTLIGERGVNLSGGQRQRVALARVLIAGARVIVLDDPLSAVDTETERLLVDTLRPALAGRTVLVSTQRLSTIDVADRAVVVVDGRIVEDGRPAALLRANGPFARLFGDEVLAA